MKHMMKHMAAAKTATLAATAAWAAEIIVPSDSFATNNVAAGNQERQSGRVLIDGAGIIESR